MSKQNGFKEECVGECLFRQAMEGLVVGLILTTPDSRVAWINRAARQFLGVEDNQAVGQPISRLLKDPRLAAFWEDTLEKDSNTLGEVSVRWPHELELKVNATPCHNPTGGLIGRALLFCDITQDRAVQIQLSQALAHRLLELTNEDRTIEEPVSGLTPQELQMLRLLGKGLSNQDIANHAHISLSTVRSHLKHIYRKLNLSSRSEAVSFAIRNNLS